VRGEQAWEDAPGEQPDWVHSSEQQSRGTVEAAVTPVEVWA